MSEATGDAQVVGDELADEAARVLERIRRIRALDRERAPAQRLLVELRELVAEAEAWARLEGDERAGAAAAHLAQAVTTREEVPLAIAGVS